VRLFKRRGKPQPITIEDVLADHEQYVQHWIEYMRRRYMVVREGDEWVAFQRPTRGRFWPQWRFMKMDPDSVGYRPVKSPIQSVKGERLPIGP
jgi:hypothetical protein